MRGRAGAGGRTCGDRGLHRALLPVAVAMAKEAIDNLDLGEVLPAEDIRRRENRVGHEMDDGTMRVSIRKMK